MRFDMAIDMKKIREQAPGLCETFDKEGFVAMLKRRGLEETANDIDFYIATNCLQPLEIGNKQRYHRGHMLILLRLIDASKISYQPGLKDVFDFEDIMSRRACLCEAHAKNVRDDAKKIQQLFVWLWTNDIAAFNPANAVLTKAVIDISLDTLDPDGFYENLHVDDGIGTYKLVQDLLAMQSEIGIIVSEASANGISIPNVQFIFDRKRQLDELASWMLPTHSPYLAVPTRDIMADERMTFIDTRNRLLAEKQYQALIEHYDHHLYYFDAEAQRHAQVCVCIGHIYGDLLKKSDPAVTAFKEALEYDPSNESAFNEVCRHLKQTQKWDALVELYSNHWDTIKDDAKRCPLILECAQIQAFHCQHITEALGLFERCMLDGYPGNDFDDLYKIIVGLMDDCTNLEKMRACVTLTMHIVNFTQCDKVIELKKKFAVSDEPFARCLASLIDAGIESFKGDQPHALEILRDAIAISPSTNLISGLLLRIASKIHADNEFREGINDLETEALSAEDLSDVWLRVAQVLLRLQKNTLALEYAQKSVDANPANAIAIDLCYSLATKLKNTESAFVYAMVKAKRAKDIHEREELLNICQDLKLTFGDDDDKRLNAYEKLLDFPDLKDEIADDLRDLCSNVETSKAIALLQRIESKCMAEMAPLMGELYQLVLDRTANQDEKKGLLERYVGFLLSQGSSVNIQTLIPVHAQLFALTPNDRLFTMFRNVAENSPDNIRSWAEYLEDTTSAISDNVRVAKIQTTLADCYQNILHDSEKAANAFANLLKAAPDNIPAFKCCFSAFERLGRFFDCIELLKNFDASRLTQQDRIQYAFKAIIFSLFHLYDAKSAQHFIELIAKEDESCIPALIDKILAKADETNFDKDQLACFLKQIEQQSNGAVALLLSLARANIIAEQGDLKTVAEILNQKTFEAARNAKFIERANTAIQKLKNSNQKEWRDLGCRWKPEPAKIETTAKENNATNSIQALVKEFAENLDDESFLPVIENALKTLSPADATLLCTQLANLCESKQHLAQAEDYFKKAFSYTQCYDLLEFYKRQRKFKKAIKIFNFKLDKTPESSKNSVKLEGVLIYEQMRDYPGAIRLLDDVLASGQLDTNGHIAVLRQKSACLVQNGQIDDAVNALKDASAVIDKAIRSNADSPTPPANLQKLREEIDVETCFLLRESSPADAKKLQQSLMLRGAKTEKAILLNLAFDIDAMRFAEAKNKIDTLLQSANDFIVTAALEQKLTLLQKQQAPHETLCATARELLSRNKENARALQILQA